MGIAGDSCKHLPAAWSLAAKLCDSCKSSAALLFCRADSAYLCIDCDAKIHGANKLASRHERVWLCEVCEQAPASVTCKADAAALCVTCDRDIHSANPLARRHERFPVVPFYDSPVKSAAGAINFLVPSGEEHAGGELDDDEDGGDSFHEEAEAASWLLPNPNSKIVDAHDIKSGGDILFADMDPFLDFDYAGSIDAKFHHHQQLHSSGADSVVPVQTKTSQPPVMNHHHESLGNCYESELCRSKISSFNSYASQSLSHSVSSSSMDVGVVPDGNSLSDASYSFGRQVNNNIDFGISTTTTATTTTALNQTVSSQLTGLDREARVLRYREKRKNRKFEKTIRYASRKAYAETRPRIKGRFAKRTDIDSDVDTIYASSGAFMVDTRYGVVPSF